MKLYVENLRERQKNQDIFLMLGGIHKKKLNTVRHFNTEELWVTF